jgi:hypothetical protein
MLRLLLLDCGTTCCPPPLLSHTHTYTICIHPLHRSGLLECPITTRIRTEVDAPYVVRVSGPSCDAASVITTPSECMGAVFHEFAPDGGVEINHTITTSSTQPAGCSVTAAQDGSILALFNDAKDATAQCGAGFTQSAGKTESLVSVHVQLNGPKVRQLFSCPQR